MTDQPKIAKANVKLDPKHMVRCDACGMMLPVIELVDGTQVAVQPMPVQPVVPARPKIQLAGPTPPMVAVKKLLERTWEGTLGAPVFITHNHVCPRGGHGMPTLLQSLDPPEEVMKEVDES